MAWSLKCYKNEPTQVREQNSVDNPETSACDNIPISTNAKT